MATDFETPEYIAWKASQATDKATWRELLVEGVERAETALLKARAALLAWDMEQESEEGE